MKLEQYIRIYVHVANLLVKENFYRVYSFKLFSGFIEK